MFSFLWVGCFFAHSWAESTQENQSWFGPLQYGCAPKDIFFCCLRPVFVNYDRVVPDAMGKQIQDVHKRERPDNFGQNRAVSWRSTTAWFFTNTSSLQLRNQFITARVHRLGSGRVYLLNLFPKGTKWIEISAACDWQITPRPVSTRKRSCASPTFGKEQERVISPGSKQSQHFTIPRHLSNFRCIFRLLVIRPFWTSPESESSNAIFFLWYFPVVALHWQERHPLHLNSCPQPDQLQGIKRQQTGSRTWRMTGRARGEQPVHWEEFQTSLYSMACATVSFLLHHEPSFATQTETLCRERFNSVCFCCFQPLVFLSGQNFTPVDRSLKPNARNEQQKWTSSSLYNGKCFVLRLLRKKRRKRVVVVTSIHHFRTVWDVLCNEQVPCVLLVRAMHGREIRLDFVDATEERRRRGERK